MARRKLQFTEEQNFRIAQMVEINKTLEEISDDLKRNYDLKISLPTLSKHIESLGLNRLDGRKWNARDAKNHKDGYVLDKEIKAKKKPLSRYSIKKHFNGDEIASAEEAKEMGYNNDGSPIFYKMIVGKEGYVEDVEWRNDTDALNFTGGEKCNKLSRRWWIVQRMKFDLGDKFRPLVPGQIQGDWRGVVDRFKYTDEGFLRLGSIKHDDFMSLHQEAWERFVDAVYSYKDTTKGLGEKDKYMHNRFILNNMRDFELEELIKLGPDIIYHYIPQYLYGVVINYCLSRMKSDRRIPDKESVADSIDRLMDITSYINTAVNDYNTNTISFEVIKRCLNLHPNDYDIVIKVCLFNAINLNLIDKNAIVDINDILCNLYFKRYEIDNPNNKCDDVDWFTVGNKKLYKAVYGRIENLNKVCKKYNLIPINIGV